MTVYVLIKNLGYGQGKVVVAVITNPKLADEWDNGNDREVTERELDSEITLDYLLSSDYINTHLYE